MDIVMTKDTSRLYFVTWYDMDNPYTECLAKS